MLPSNLTIKHIQIIQLPYCKLKQSTKTTFFKHLAISSSEKLIYKQSVLLCAALYEVLASEIQCKRSTPLLSGSLAVDVTLAWATVSTSAHENRAIHCL